MVYVDIRFAEWSRWSLAGVVQRSSGRVVADTSAHKVSVKPTAAPDDIAVKPAGEKRTAVWSMISQSIWRLVYSKAAPFLVVPKQATFK